ncbi:23S rRNA methyltransferase [Pseudoclavibacter endophyticus]|uniref:Class I SAM-dependent RNA methyltransferase n=1 Tax=Pseudoclavibacter endophyticus TaxID=1778590 RepID=A0A6H9WQA5_9MICO|nr:TRAM domain-containing protein [Pseudoclavibacter endophyticus]KAB1648205.1 class I SAM-dependent RNA methyltransferase [Pseudoclavibacter endophyticus]GGA70601.1 23S rRNA methyltransferase [Pseudoclavibacter endophyticus]
MAGSGSGAGEAAAGATRSARDSGPPPGAELELEPTGIAHGGFAVARHEGRVVFIADGIPGEPVRALITESKASFSRAVAIAPLTPSEHRIQHVWPEAGIDRAPELRAGGAEFGHIRLPHQRALKAEVVIDALQRFGGVEGSDLRSLVVAPMPGDDDTSGTRWRTRVTLHIDDEGRIGPYAARSHRVIPVTSLPLAVTELEARAPLDGTLPELSHGGGTVRLGTGTGERRGPGRVDLVASAGDGAHVRVRLERGPKQRPAGVITERARGIDFAVDEDGFWQVHRHAADALAETVADLAGPRLDPEAQHLDLYGGVGLFAATFASLGAPYVETVESAAGATEHARRNLAPWRGPTAVTARVDRYLRDLEGELTAADRTDLAAGTILLDPPRAGAGREIANAIAALRPAQIIYVACDPVALARDVRTLRDDGYVLDEVRALDLFPNTHHVECVARLVREGTA